MSEFQGGVGAFRRSICLSASLIGLIGATPAFAQNNGASGQEEAQAIVITGSRLRVTGMETPVPVTAVQATELKSMAPNTLVDGLSQLPQFYGNSTPQQTGNFFNSGSSGGLNLRGLGANRTLVLLNGRRMISATAFGGVDISVFPEALISNVETVTGGASAAYGTDAVAGVTNFILNTKFTGFKAEAQAGETTHGDGKNFRISGTAGFRLGDRGHFIVSAELYNHDGIHNYGGRNWYQAWGPITDSSGTIHYYPNVVSTNATFDGLIFAPGTPINGMVFNPDGSVSPFVASGIGQNGTGIPPSRQSITNGGSGDDLGGGDVYTLYPDFERSNIFAYADYEVANNFKVFAQYIRGRKTTSSYNTPRGSFGGTPTALTIFQDNAYLPDNLRQMMIDNNIASFTLRRMGHTSDIAGNMKISDENVMNSATAGFNWDIRNGGFMDGWNVEGYYQYGESTRKAYQIGLRVDRIFAAIDAVRDPSTGNIVCRTSLYSDYFAGCQPLDLFGRGNASPQAVDYVVGFDPGQKIDTPLYFADSGYSLGLHDSYVSQEAKVNITKMKQHIVELSANGELYHGWGAGAINLAFGGSYRQEKIRQIVRDPSNPPSDHTDGHPVLCNTDPEAIAAGLRGVSAGDCANTVGLQYSKVSNINGKIDVKEAFGELLVPILADKPMFKQLTIDVATRWADYSGSGSVWAYKGGIDWTVIDGLRLRGTYSRDVRAANLSERFDKTGGSATLMDPRYPDNADGAGNPTTQVTRYSGGNPNVSPEKADTFTAGVVVQPAVIDGLSVSLDWYRIKMKDAIDQVGTQAVVNNCEEGQQEFCALVTRDPTTDRLVLVGDVYVNISQSKTEGIDLEMNYHRRVNFFGGAESLSARGFGSWLLESSQNGKDRAGQTGIQQSDGRAYALPDFKATANLTYRIGGFSTFLQGRYISPGTQENSLGDVAANHVDSAFYTDVRLSYQYDMPSGRTVEVYGTVTNLFDKAPPLTPYYSAFLGYPTQANSLMFDTIGRRFVVGVKVSL